MMPSNPSPDIELARDACDKLNVSMAILVTLKDDGTFTTASYGKSEAQYIEACAVGKVLHHGVLLAYYLTPGQAVIQMKKLIASALKKCVDQTLFDGTGVQDDPPTAYTQT